MKILTPVRRHLTRSADRHLRALADQWTDKSSGHAAVMGRSIKQGMIYRRLRELALRDGRFPTGVIQVPPRSAEEGPPPHCAMAGFEVDLDKLNERLAVPTAPKCRSRVRGMVDWECWRSIPCSAEGTWPDAVSHQRRRAV